MKILIAEDDLVSRTMLERTLVGWNHEVVTTCDGLSAWKALSRDDAPKLAILDWMMPIMEGAEVCRRVRSLSRVEPTYLILLTSRHEKADIVAGLESGANDYIVKPFERSELRSRIRAGERILHLQHDLAMRIEDLERALAEVRQLRGLLPICSYCKKIRDDDNYWQVVETYLAKQTDVQFSHGICPDCFSRIARELSADGAPVDMDLGLNTPAGTR